MTTLRGLVPNLAARLAKRGLAQLSEPVRRSFRSVRDHLFAEMDYAPEGWAAHASTAANWSAQSVAHAQERHWPTLLGNLQGTGPLGFSHHPWSRSREDRVHHNTMMSFGYVLARAARNKDRLSMLDWGGGAGHYYLYSKALLPEVELDYHCVDVAPLCEVGQRLLPDAHFHSDAAELRRNTFDLVISSSALHYFENWPEAARDLVLATGDFLYIARLQTVFSTPSFVAIHNVNRMGYPEFLSWCLNRDEIVSCVESAGMRLLREFVYGNSWAVRGAPERAETRGFLFRRQSSVARSGGDAA